MRPTLQKKRALEWRVRAPWRMGAPHPVLHLPPRHHPLSRPRPSSTYLPPSQSSSFLPRYRAPLSQLNATQSGGGGSGGRRRGVDPGSPRPPAPLWASLRADAVCAQSAAALGDGSPPSGSNGAVAVRVRLRGMVNAECGEVEGAGRRGRVQVEAGGGEDGRWLGGGSWGDDCGGWKSGYGGGGGRRVELAAGRGERGANGDWQRALVRPTLRALTARISNACQGRPDTQRAACAPPTAAPRRTSPR